MSKVSVLLDDINKFTYQCISIAEMKGGTIPEERQEGIIGLKDLPSVIDSIPDPEAEPQTKSVTITQNGDTTVTPDSGYTLSQVNITTIVSGGGDEPEEKVLNFYDCFGKRVASYANNEILGLNALPTPTDYGSDEIPMTFQSWGMTLTQIKMMNTNYPNEPINVCASYVPTDGKTHLKFRIGEHDTNGVQFTITTTGGTVNWGDGTSQTISSTTLSHVYSNAGDYDCTLTGITSFVMYSSTTGDQKYYVKLIEARVGSSVTSIGSNAFRQCYSLTSITIPSSVTSIGTYEFYNCYSLTSITIPSSVTSIGERAFQYCYSLTSITIPSGVTSISAYAFSNCNSLTSITIPSGITSIDSSSFYSCYSLTNITIPSGVTSIGSSSFSGCYSLTSITIPSGVTSIGSISFSSCYSLVEVIMKGSVPPTLSSTNAFNTTYLKHIYVPSSAVSTYKSTSNWLNFSSIISANPY